MLRVHCLQQLFNLSDLAVEERCTAASRCGLQGRVSLNAQFEDQVFVGIDVAKAHIDVRIIPGDRRGPSANDASGIAALVSILRRFATSREGDGDDGHSKSQVSRLCADIDERVNAFLSRPLEGDWPYLWIDATYVKVRQAGRIVSVAVIIAVAVNTDGIREIVGVAVGPSEADRSGRRSCATLPDAACGVKLVISDAHLGLKAAIAKVFTATWQRCRVHFMRNALAFANKGQRQMVLALINTAFAQETTEAAHEQWRVVADHFREKLPKLAAMLDDSENEVLAFMNFPRAHPSRSHRPIRSSDSTPR